jgi:hypothetical protein
MDGYRATSDDHAEKLTTALDQFFRALTRRWREEVCRALASGSADYPRSMQAGSSASYPGANAPAWEYTLIPNWRHVMSGTCAYITWALGDQESDLSAVTCEGFTDATAEMWTNPYTGETNFIPAYVECGMGRILVQVEDWAFAERQHVYQQVPPFTGHERRALQEAHDTFVALGGRLGLEPETDSVPGSTELFQPATGRDIGSLVHGLAGDREGPDWWVGWTGLAASRYKEGFFASVAPSLNNQSGILGSLANLYAERAAIIEKGRNDTLYWLERATESLDETAMVPDRRGWLMLQGLGTGVSGAFGWSGAGRYLVAGEQVQAAAESYVEVDTEGQQQLGAFNRIIGEWPTDGFRPPDVDFDPGEHAGATDRAPGWAPPQEDGGPGPRPGEGDGDEYETEADAEGAPR